MKLRSALLAATVLAAAPVAAKAQAVNGLYIGAGAGVNFMEDQEITSFRFPERATLPAGGTVASAPANNKVRMDPGFIGLVSVGYGLGNGLRLEVEGSYRQNKFHGISTRGATAVFLGAGGDEMKYAGMFNVAYDFAPSVLGLGFLPIVPYVGVGAGYAWVQHKNAHFYGATPAFAGAPGGTPISLRTNDGEGSFAYQAFAGVSYALTAVPGLYLSLEYRFMGVNNRDDYNYQYLQGKPVPGVSTRAKIKFEDDYNHSVLVGLRYAFNAAPPPPPPVAVTPPPVREAARTYLVFFDWDRADLTARARQVIAEAAQATTRVQVTRIQVNGYTDTSGTPRYNQGLSVRRAQNVANELVRDGVPRSAISIQGFGETHLLVPTADGVREPQNRRVEIILQ